MGNTPSGLRLLGNGKYSSYHIKLYDEATISVKKEEDGHQRSQKWELLYDVEGITSRLFICKTTEGNSDDEKLSIAVNDCFSVKRSHATTTAIRSQTNQSIYVKVQKGKQMGRLSLKFEENCYIWENNVKKSGKSFRGETVTYFFAYGRGTRTGLLVIEMKKKMNEEEPYMATVAHYYVNSGGGGGNLGGSGVDIGFSIVVNIGVVSHNGGLDFSVDGPVEHPSSALLYMIEEVTRTGTWKLSACPHCKNIQWQRRWLSESEDSDATPLPPPPPPPRHGGAQKATNKGQFNGDGNGNIIQANKINFNKWWK